MKKLLTIGLTLLCFALAPQLVNAQEVKKEVKIEKKQAKQIKSVEKEMQKEVQKKQVKETKPSEKKQPPKMIIRKVTNQKRKVAPQEDRRQ